MDEDQQRRLLEDGRRAFNLGEFYESHEFWEDVWNEIDDPERTWVQGMIQVATGLHKLQRERPDVCRTLLQKALTKLADVPPALFGYDLARLCADARRVYHAVEQGQPADARSVKLGKAPISV
jgi:predicted metal-dependent hydrolase